MNKHFIRISSQENTRSLVTCTSLRDWRNLLKWFRFWLIGFVSPILSLVEFFGLTQLVCGSGATISIRQVKVHKGGHVPKSSRNTNTNTQTQIHKYICEKYQDKVVQSPGMWWLHLFQVRFEWNYKKSKRNSSPPHRMIFFYT